MAKKFKAEYTAGQLELIYVKKGEMPDEKYSDPSQIAHLARTTYLEGTIEAREYFKVFLFNGRGRCMGYNTIGIGGSGECYVDLKPIFQSVLLSNARMFAVVHNHPSGSIKPSKYDDSITEEIRKGAKLFGVQFLDHIILTIDDYYSYHENDRICLFTPKVV